MRERLNRPAKAGFFYIMTSFAAKAAGFLSTPLFARVLSPQEYGLYPLYLSLLGIFSTVLGVGISASGIYRALGKYRGREDELLSGAVGLLLIPLTAVLVLGIFIRERIEGLLGLSPFLSLILLAEVFISQAELMLFAANRYKYLFLRVCLTNLLYSLLSPALSLGLIYLTPFRAEARVIASFAVRAALIIPQLLPHIRVEKLYTGAVLRYLVRLSLPLLPHAVFMSLIAQSDKLIIERLGGTAELAHYSVAYSVGFMLTVITNALYGALQPWLMRKLNSNDTATAKLFMARVIFLVSMGLSFFLLFAPELFALVAGEQYRSAEIAVFPLAIAGVLQFIVNILSAGVIHAERSIALSLFSLSAFAINLALNLLLIPRLGILVAAVTTAISYALLIALEYSFLRNRHEDRLITRESLLPLAFVALPLLTRAFAMPLASRAIFAAALVLFAAPTGLSTYKMVRETAV